MLPSTAIVTCTPTREKDMAKIDWSYHRNG
jgi:hypothetical protein